MKAAQVEMKLPGSRFVNSLARAFIDMPEAKMVMTAKAMEFKARTRSSKAFSSIPAPNAPWTVIERHHEHCQKDHRGIAPPIEMCRGDAYLAPLAPYHQLQRAEVGRDERQSSHPRGNGPQMSGNLRTFSCTGPVPNQFEHESHVGIRIV